MVSCMVSLGCVPPMCSLFYVWYPCIATVYGSVYGPAYGPCMVNIFLGESPGRPYAEVVRLTIRKPRLNRLYASLPQKPIRGTLWFDPGEPPPLPPPKPEFMATDDSNKPHWKHGFNDHLYPLLLLSCGAHTGHEKKDRPGAQARKKKERK